MGRAIPSAESILLLWVTLLKVIQGLFGYIDGVVRNLNVTESYIYFELFSYIGGIAGRSDGTIQDCSYSGKVTGQSTVGGIAGYSSGTVKNCINRGTVTSSGSGADNSYIGGIAGYSIGTVENCTNSGTVKGNGADRVGGIGGDASEIKNCSNSGAVTGDNNVGGIAGNCVEIKNCSNSGAVTGDGYVGGIAGMAVNSTHSDGFLENCFNAGTVTGTSKVGGIAGDVFSTTQTITRCYYLDTSCAKGLGGDKSSATIVTESKDKEEFAGGEVTRLLQGERTERIWGQKLDGSEDSLPVLLSFLSEEERAGYIVYTVTFTYEETPDATEKATEVQYGNSGAAITAPTVSEAKGYLFVWDKEIPRAIDTENVEINGEFKKLFTLTIYQPDDDGHGSFIATAGGEEIKSGSDVAEGTEVTLVPTPDEGYGVDKWLVKDSEDKEIEVLDENTFVMPSDNVTVTVVFAKESYTLTIVQPTGGAITAMMDAVEVKDGEGVEFERTVAFSITIDDGYEFSAWRVTETGSGKEVELTENAFTMPAAAVTVTAIVTKLPEPEPEEPEPEEPDTPQITYYDVRFVQSNDSVNFDYKSDQVREGNTFSFSASAVEGYDPKTLVVEYRRGPVGIWREATLDTDGKYHIRANYADLYIRARVEPLVPTGIEQVGDEAIVVYADNGTICVYTPSEERVIIVSMSGAVVRMEEQVGTRRYTDLSDGVYIVRVGERSWKVRI